jgi:putative phosphoribosyl transferase
MPRRHHHRTFADRHDAGRQLAEALRELQLEQPLVLALPRGGVPVAYEVALALDADLDVLVARKIGAPRQPELGLGAVAEGGEPMFDQRFLRTVGVTEADLAPTVEREREELRRRVERYRGGRDLPSMEGRDVILVDDGLATGSTARAGLAALRPRHPKRLLLAVPVASPRTVEALAADADEIVCLQQPASFQAVGQWYRDFTQTGDEVVLRLLAEAREAHTP